MKIFNAEQIKAIDQFTIVSEPIASLDLMERAARACVRRLLKLLPSDEKILVICGKGNNGGDGLVIGKILLQNQLDVHCYVVPHREAFSDDAAHHHALLKESFADRVHELASAEELTQLMQTQAYVVIDALFGTGIDRAPEGIAAEVIDVMNHLAKNIVSIDMPSGLYADKSSADNKHIVRSSLTLSFQNPKLAFMMPQNGAYVPEFELLNIGLHAKAIEAIETEHFYVSKQLVQGLLKKRTKFSHKGTYGHALLLAGSKGKSGAALMAAKACLKCGAGLITLHSVKEALQANLVALPEAMSSEDICNTRISELVNLEKYNAVGIGSGIGTHEDTAAVLKKLLHYNRAALLLDADALNILSENKTWLNFLPPNSILTPHPKEFERLTEKHHDDFERLKALKLFSMTYKCIVVLKGAHTAIAMPDGHVFFNSSGNAALAKGGSGDVLTGMILGLLARGYNAPQAALIGTFVHGYAADLLLKKNSMESLLASDVIDKLGVAFRKLED